MKCWHCDALLIWGGDNETTGVDGQPMLETNLSCPECDSVVLVYIEIEETVELIDDRDNEGS